MQVDSPTPRWSVHEQLPYAALASIPGRSAWQLSSGNPTVQLNGNPGSEGRSQTFESVENRVGGYPGQPAVLKSVNSSFLWIADG